MKFLALFGAGNRVVRGCLLVEESILFYSPLPLTADSSGYLARVNVRVSAQQEAAEPGVSPAPLGPAEVHTNS